MTAHAKPTILIIDDIPENLEILMEVLKDDYRIFAAKGGDKGLRLAFSEPPPDLILLDIIMPDINGFEVCKRLKDDPRTQIYRSSLSPVSPMKKTKTMDWLWEAWTLSPNLFDLQWSSFVFETSSN